MFTDINQDLTYSLPRQTLVQWQADVLEAITLRPEHLSLQCLSAEEGTPLTSMISPGRLPYPNPNLAGAIYSWAEKSLVEAGCEHCEICNWTRTGYECQHDVAYWRNRPYLRFGAGADSFYDDKVGVTMSSRQRSK